jgi:hypothetical protein
MALSIINKNVYKHNYIINMFVALKLHAIIKFEPTFVNVSKSWERKKSFESHYVQWDF